MIERSVFIDYEQEKVFVDLPFIRDPVEFLSKKHNGPDNRYQAVRVYKTQCRKSEVVKEQLRNAHRELVEKGFMVKFSDLSEDQKKTI